MHSELFTIHVGTSVWTVMSYSFFYTCAAIFVVSGTLIATLRIGVKAQKLSVLLVVVMIGGFVGARLWHMLTNWPLYSAGDAHMYAMHMENFAIVGGLVGAIITGYVVSVILCIDPWKIADRAVIFVGGGIALARIGCFLNGCCFGHVTQMPWGLKFPLMSNAHVYHMSHGEGSPFSVRSVHPTQLYELIYVLIGSGIAWYFVKKNYPPGVAAAAFGLWYAFCRILNMHFRVLPDSLQISADSYAMIYVMIMVICSFTIYMRKKSGLCDIGMNQNMV